MPPRPAAVSFVTALAMSAGAACGDAAADRDFRGEPLAVVACNLVFERSSKLEGPLRATFVWERSDRLDGLVAAAAGDVAIDVALSHVRVELLEAPDDALARGDAGIVGRLFLGQVIVYADLDGDGRFGRGDAVRGADASVVAYAPDGARGVTIGVLPAGVARVFPALDCQPDRARFDAFVTTDATDLYVGPKWEGALFHMTCPPPAGTCDNLEAVRAACWRDARAELCLACPDGAFPEGASEGECDAWRARCESDYFAGECATQYAHCLAGDLPCDARCGCEQSHDACLADAHADQAVCQQKYDICLDALE